MRVWFGPLRSPPMKCSEWDLQASPTVSTGSLRVEITRSRGRIRIEGICRPKAIPLLKSLQSSNCRIQFSQPLPLSTGTGLVH